MGDLNNYLDLLKSQYRPPLPPKRKIELIRTEVNMTGRCCSCIKNTGKLTCGRCKAIKYCGQQCQKEGSMMEGRSEGKGGSLMEGWPEGKKRFMEAWMEGKNGWKDHKNFCSKIKKHTEETNAAIEKLSEEFGGTDSLLQSPLVKKGLFVTNFEVKTEKARRTKALKEEYILARMKLIDAYAECGEEALSCTAFRLAAENMLDVLCLTYSQEINPKMRYDYCGWMVAAGMDQQALNYICYFRHRLMSPHSLPYLDMSQEEDIEGVSYLKLFKEKKNDLDLTAQFMWFHDYMLIVLIKYKRLQSLIVQKNEKCEMEETITIRMNQLGDQIKQILSDVHACKPLIIPAVIGRNVDISDNEYWDIRSYVHAWLMSPDYIEVLDYFLRTGQVMPTFKKQEVSLDKKLGCSPGARRTPISEVAKEDGGKIPAPVKAAGSEKVKGCFPGQFDEAIIIPNKDDPDLKQYKTKVEGCFPDAGLLQASFEFVKENIGKEMEKEKGNLSPEIVGEMSDLEMYTKICWFCSKEGVKLFKCGCRKARYCTKQCQEEDWEEHGGYCIKKQEKRKAKKRQGGDE